MDAQDRAKVIYRTTLVGTVGNLLLLIFKFVAGILGRSSAMIADAVHSLSDFITDVIVMVFVRISSKPKDSDHQYGHGKYETLATAVIGIMLFVIGLGILWSGGEKVWRFMHGEELPEPGLIALIAAVLSIVVKEGLYHYTMHKARKVESTVMEANAWHHRSDAFSSIATAIGIGGAIIFGVRWRILDPIAAMIVSILIIKVALELSAPAINELLEVALPKELEDKILQTICEFPEVSSPHNLRTRRIGPNVSIEFHVRMPGNMTVSESHAVTRRIERTLRDRFGQGTFINIHVEPAEEAKNTDDNVCKSCR